MKVFFEKGLKISLSPDFFRQVVPEPWGPTTNALSHLVFNRASITDKRPLAEDLNVHTGLSTHTRTHEHTPVDRRVPPADYDTTQCFNFIVAEEAMPPLSRNINMNSAILYKDEVRMKGYQFHSYLIHLVNALVN